jgi:hypothetical protein
MSSALILEGDLDRHKLESTVHGLMQRHDALRTSFAMVDGEPVQVIHQQSTIPIEYLEATELELKDLVVQFIQPHDLGKAPLFRIGLVRFAENKHLLCFDMHHIVSDGVSMSILTRDFANLYAGKELAPLRIQYKDYALWHNTLIETETMHGLSEYWMSKLEEFTYTELPQTMAASTGQPEGRLMQVLLNEELTTQINSFCQQHQVTRFAFLYGVFQVILMKILQQDQITMGIPVAGRRNEELENVIGVFLNVLTIQTKLDKEESFKDFLASVKHNLLEAQEHQDYPYDTLYANVKERWNYRHNSLFSILFNYMPYEGDQQGLQLDHLVIQPYSSKEVEPKYPLTLYVNEGENVIGLNAVYQSSLDEQMMEVIMSNFSFVIETVLKEEEILIKEVVLTGEEIPNLFMEDFGMEFDNDELF